MATATTPYSPARSFTNSAADNDLPYRALSRGAVLSVVLFIPALPGLVPTFEPMLVLSLFGLVSGLFAVRLVRRYPGEYSGGLLAQVGVLVNALLLVGGSVMHTSIYLTEVPEGYERVGFYELVTPEKVADAPTMRAVELDGTDVFLKGYIHPNSGNGQLSRFVLVPDLGTCCFGGEPRSSSMIEVVLPNGQTVRAGKLKIKLAGKFVVNKFLQKNHDFDNAVFYRLQADMVN